MKRKQPSIDSEQKKFYVECKNPEELKLLEEYQKRLRTNTGLGAEIKQERKSINQMVDMMKKISTELGQSWSEVLDDLTTYIKSTGYKIHEVEWKFYVQYELPEIEELCIRDNTIEYLKDFHLKIEISPIYQQYYALAKDLDEEMFEIYKRNIDVAAYRYNFDFVPGQVIWSQEVYTFSNLPKNEGKKNEGKKNKRQKWEITLARPFVVKSIDRSSSPTVETKSSSSMIEFEFSDLIVESKFSSRTAESNESKFPSPMIEFKSPSSMVEVEFSNSIAETKFPSSVAEFKFPSSMTEVKSSSPTVETNDQLYYPPTISPSVWFCGNPPPTYVKYQSQLSYGKNGKDGKDGKNKKDRKNRDSDLDSDDEYDHKSVKAKCWLEAIESPDIDEKLKKFINDYIHGKFVYGDNNDKDLRTRQVETIIKFIKDKSTWQMYLAWNNFDSVLSKADCVKKITKYGHWKSKAKISNIDNKIYEYDVKFCCDPVYEYDCFFRTNYFTNSFIQAIRTCLFMLPKELINEIFEYLNAGFVERDKRDMDVGVWVSLEK